MILAGGEGKRLGPLTLDRAKPAVPFGGRYRIIDIVLSNFVNSGLSRIKILTQYKSASLEEHIARVWRLSPMLDNFIETIPAQQRTGKSWFAGSADAVYQCQHVITDENPDHVCIFGGDHVYKMDVRQMIAQSPRERRRPHRRRHPGAARRGARLRRHRDATTTGASSPSTRRSQNPPADAGQPDMASRRWATTSSRPTRSSTSSSATPATRRRNARLRARHPPAHGARRAGASSSTTSPPTSSPARSERERGYWRDIGTVEAYWAAQMDLVAIQPLFNLYNARWPIRTGVTHDPPAKFVFRDEAHARVGIATD